MSVCAGKLKSVHILYDGVTGTAGSTVKTVKEFTLKDSQQALAGLMLHCQQDGNFGSK